MNLLIKSKKYRGYLLLGSYVALFAHFVIMGGYYLSLYNSDMPPFPYLTYIVLSSICIVIYISLALCNERYGIAILKTAVALPLLILNLNHPLALASFTFLYYLVAFFDMYEFNVKYSA